jgi:uncharacterized delta-60 repeat protein
MPSLSRPGKKIAFTAALVGVLATAAAAAGRPTAGTLDHSFGHDGKVVTGFENHGAPPSGIAVPHANAVLIDSKGRTVAVGSAYDEFALARYRPNGRLDPAFSHDGKAMTQVITGSGPLEPSGAYAGALDSHGRIIAAGVTSYNGRAGGLVALVRYRPNGHVDRSFGRRGRVITDIGPGISLAFAIAIDKTGRLVVAGRAGDHFGLARYLPDGSLDRSFGSDGRVVTGFGSDSGIDEADSIAIDSRGRIVAGGFTEPTRSSTHFALARYEPDGTLDPTFGTGGKVTTELLGHDILRSIAIDDQDRVIAAGVSRRLVDDDADKFALARYNTDGSLDGTFGAGGLTFTAFNGASRATAMTLDSRHRIVVAGRVSHSQVRRFALARYGRNGNLNVGFSGNGKVTTKFGDGSKIQSANAAAIGGRGRIVAAGYAGRRMALARYFGRSSG